MLRVGGRAVCDARALLALCDATFDLPPTLRAPVFYYIGAETIICACEGSDCEPPWNMHPEGVLEFVRDFEEPVAIRADRIEQWLDKWTPLWRMARMSAIDAAETPVNEEV